MNIFKKIYIKTSGYSYTNMGRLFLRLFVGIMLMQFGIRQWCNFDTTVLTFPSVLGMSPNAALVTMIVIELVCSFFIMIGCLTRLMTLPPFLAMILSESYILTELTTSQPTYSLDWAQVGYVPVLFMGIYFFIILVGPGKISVDYFLSLYFIHNHNHSEAELEEV